MSSFIDYAHPIVDQLNGVHIPEEFVRTAWLDPDWKYERTKERKAILSNSHHPNYWEEFDALIEEAEYRYDGYNWKLHFGGDLFIIRTDAPEWVFDEFV